MKTSHWIDDSTSATLEVDRDRSGRRQVVRRKRASSGEEVMNRTQSAIVEKETCTATAGVTTAEPQPKPYLVKGQERSGDTITRRVEEALDFEFAQGRMPA